MKRYFKNPVVLFIFFSRILAAVYIFFNPLWGFILSSFFDWFDWYVLENKTRIFTVSEYQRWDKNMDWFMYTFMLLVGFKYGAFNILLIFFLFKFIGHLIYLKSRDRRVFVLFPNFLEGAFLWYIIFKLPNIQNIFNFSPYLSGLTILLTLEFIKELWMHIALPWYLDRYGYPGILGILGVKKQVNRGKI